jgi:hypothetical protein
MLKYASISGLRLTSHVKFITAPVASFKGMEFCVLIYSKSLIDLQYDMCLQGISKQGGQMRSRKMTKKTFLLRLQSLMHRGCILSITLGFATTLLISLDLQ